LHFSFPADRLWIPAFAGMTVFLLIWSVVHLFLPTYLPITYTLEAILKQLIKNQHQLTLDIATGFSRIEAWLRLEDAMNQLAGLRLLIGRDPAMRPSRERSPPRWLLKSDRPLKKRDRFP